MSRLPGRIALGLIVASQAGAQVTRQTIIVDRPPNMPRVAAEIAEDADAKKLFIEATILDRFSPKLLRLRGNEIRAALTPSEDLIPDFKVLSREDQDGRVKVVAEGDPDLGSVLLRLVNAKVLSFGAEPPRILVASAPGTSAGVAEGLRGRLGSTLGAAGFQLVAGAPRGRVGNDLVATIRLTSEPAPSPAGGVILDGALQFTVVRPRDNAVLAEQVLKSRASGASRLLAEQAMLDELAPAMARSLGAQLASAVFASTEIVDPTATLSRKLRLDVYFRPSPVATSSLVNMLRQHQLDVSLSKDTTQAPVKNRVGDAAFAAKQLHPTERLVVDGAESVSDVYRILSTSQFGRGPYSASVIEYGDDYIGLEIVDAGHKAAPQAAAVAKAPAVEGAAQLASSSSGSSSAPAGPRPPLQLRKRIR
jgi:hypothetical protein